MNENEDRHQSCPQCGSKDAEFRYTEPSYGDWWKCKKCGKEFPGRQERYDEFMHNIKGGLSNMEDKERELLKSYRTLLDHVETCLNCRLKMEEILQHMIDAAKAKASREALELLEKKREK